MNEAKINALLERAAYPLLTELDREAAMQLSCERRRNILLIADEEYDGSLVAMTAHLTDMLNRIQNALEKVLDQRDRAVQDIKRCDIDCETCAYQNADPDVCIKADCDCATCKSECRCRECVDSNRYMWRGMVEDLWTHQS